MSAKKSKESPTKRSEINEIPGHNATVLFHARRISALPASRPQNGGSSDQLPGRKCSTSKLGWDVTAFGGNILPLQGLTLFTLVATAYQTAHAL